MKNRYDRVVDFNIFLNKGHTIGGISIPIDYVSFALNNGQTIETAEANGPCVTNERDDETILENYEQLVEWDISNVGRCMLFLCAKYPHASFVPMSDSIGINNLTLDEMIVCLNQECLRLRYSVVKNNGTNVKR